MYIEIDDGPTLPLEHQPPRSLTEASREEFLNEWNRAPDDLRDGTEQSIAEYFFLRGRQSGINEATELAHQDLTEMARVAQIRTENAR